MLLLSSGLTPSFRSRLLLSLRSVIGVRFTMAPAPDFVAFIGCCCWLLVLIVFNCVGAVYCCICFYCLVVYYLLFCTYVCRTVLRTLVFIYRLIVGLYFFPLSSSVLCSAHFYFPMFHFFYHVYCCLLFPLCCQSCAHTSFHHIVLAIMCSIGCGD